MRDSAEEKRLEGAALIASVSADLPSGPGVYEMLDGGGGTLYIGKASNLRKRVASYASISRHGNRIAGMVTRVRELRYTITRSETDALLLEASLIKRRKPKYNVLLQDSKSYPYILLARDHDAPQILKHRGGRTRKGSYFGPFASVRAVNQTLRLLQGAFLLRSCSDGVYANRRRPCLLYQIKRCSAPCVGKISLSDYAALTQEAEEFLRGRSRRLQDSLAEKMRRASEALDYEGAAVYRDRIAALTRVQETQSVLPRGVADADVFAASRQGGRVCVMAFLFRGGQNWGGKAYFPRHGREQGAAEVLDAFLGQFYEGREAPGWVLLDREVAGAALLAEALSLRRGREVRVAVPQRGEKRALVALAAENAREALGRHVARHADRREMLERLGALLGMSAAPRRVEVYDNSHIQGSAAVGAMVVAGEEGFSKKSYRKFSLPLGGGDDYAMMREMLRRRLARLPAPLRGEAAVSDGFPERPDVLLIDGGVGQLSAAVEVVEAAGVGGVVCVAIAKGKQRNAGRETLFLRGRAPVRLDVQDPLLHYLQGLRDEAHRFAIGFHRDRRSRGIRESALDEIPGIGAKRKRALLNHFGSQRMIAGASCEDLSRVDGISQALAATIFAHFRG